MGLFIDSIYKSYQNGDIITNVLNNISLNIEDGEFVSIVGPSGSGKTTLMNIIGGLDRPTSGTYRINGQDVSQMKGDKLAEIRNEYIGFVFQAFNLLPQYNALENVELPLLYNKKPTGDAREKAKQALGILGLEDRMKYKPNQLSGGQKQRVAIARAIVNAPAIILADEPTGSLDSKTGQEVINIFKELNSQGKTIIIVTHDLNIAEETRRMIKIKDGMVEVV